MAETAEALDADEIAGARADVAERVERGDAGAQKRRRVGEVEPVRNRRDGDLRRDHVLGVAAVVGDAGDPRVLALQELAAQARVARTVVPAMPAEPDAIAGAKARRALAERVDDSS